MPSEDIVEAAKRYGSKSISYTYTEPTIFYEYAYDTAKHASAEGLINVFVTNGYITAEPLRELSPYLDAANIDLKYSPRDSIKRSAARNCSRCLMPSSSTGI